MLFAPVDVIQWVCRASLHHFLYMLNKYLQGKVVEHLAVHFMLHEYYVQRSLCRDKKASDIGNMSVHTLMPEIGPVYHRWIHSGRFHTPGLRHTPNGLHHVRICSDWSLQSEIQSQKLLFRNTSDVYGGVMACCGCRAIRRCYTYNASILTWSVPLTF